MSPLNIQNLMLIFCLSDQDPDKMPGAQNPWAGELKTKRKVSKNGPPTIPGKKNTLKILFLFLLF
jgi:hypothetical protein